MDLPARPTTKPAQNLRYDDPLVSGRAFALLFLLALAVALLLILAPRVHAASDLYPKSHRAAERGMTAPRI
jgi:hypothetical protein